MRLSRRCRRSAASGFDARASAESRMLEVGGPHDGCCRRHRHRALRPALRDLAGAPRAGAVRGRDPGADPAGPAPVGDARDLPELRAVRPGEGVRPVRAHRRVRRHPHVRHHERGGGGRRQGAEAARQAARPRPGDRAGVPARRPAGPAVGALRGDRLLRRRGRARRDPRRRRRRPVRGRERPCGRDRGSGGRPAVAGRAQGVLRRGAPASAADRAKRSPGRSTCSPRACPPRGR